MRFAKYLIAVALIISAILVPAYAQAQSLTTYSSLASFNAALPTTGVTSTVESFASVTSYSLVSTGVPNSWNGFTLVASGTSPWGQSAYCPSLRSCLNWTLSPPILPGVYVAVDEFSNGRLTFTPSARTFAFGFDYWDWNDGAQRSLLVVTLSNGSVINVTGPTTVSGDPGGFIGFRLDTPSIYAGISISSIQWRSISPESEIIGTRNVRASVANPVISASKISQVWDPGSAMLKAVPGNEVLYRVNVTNSGLAATDSDSVLIVDAMPSQLSFWNGDIDAGGTETYSAVGQAGFSQSNGAAMTFAPSADLRISTATTPPTSFAQCSSLSLDGTFRSNVRYLCIRPRGSLSAGPTSPTISFVFRARIE